MGLRSETIAAGVAGTMVPIHGARLPATLVLGSTRTLSLQSGTDQSGLLQLQGI